MSPAVFLAAHSREASRGEPGGVAGPAKHTAQQGPNGGLHLGALTSPREQPCTTNRPAVKGLAENPPKRASAHHLDRFAANLPGMENTWAARDLPVLDAMVKYLDEAAGASFPELRDIAELTHMEVVDVGKSALALESDHLIELGKTAGGHGTWYVRRVSGDARRLVGQWPTAEQFVDEVAQRLQAAADEEPDPERRSRLRELASSAGDVARGVFVDVTSAVISRQMGA